MDPGRVAEENDAMRRRMRERKQVMGFMFIVFLGAEEVESVGEREWEVQYLNEIHSGNSKSIYWEVCGRQ